MNLHGIVSGVIASVNPFQTFAVSISTGAYVTAANGERTPVYAAPVYVSGQVQDLTSKDLRQLDSLNIQGSQRAIYLNGELDGVVRWNGKGGDLLTLQDGTVWLTTAVLEQWPDWAKVSVTLQNGS